MSYKITENGNVATVFLDGEIDMDVTEKAKEVILPFSGIWKNSFKFKRCFLHGFFWHLSSCRKSPKSFRSLIQK